MGDAGYQMTYDRHHAPTLRLHAYRSLHPHCPHDLLSRPLQTLQRDSKGSLGLSMDDDRNFFDKDPRNLLPRTCQLEPDEEVTVIVHTQPQRTFAISLQSL